MKNQNEFQRIAMPQLQAAYRLAYALLRVRTEAEDAVQDSYLRAFRAFAQFRGEDFKPWFLTIVRNVCYRQLQQRKRGFNVISFDEAVVGRDGEVGSALEIASEAPSPEEALITAGDIGQLQHLLSELPPALREVLHLREIEEMSYQQIANATGLPIGTVMSRLSRARERLAKLVVGLKEMDGKNVL